MSRIMIRHAGLLKRCARHLPSNRVAQSTSMFDRIEPRFPPQSIMKPDVFAADFIEQNLASFTTEFEYPSINKRTAPFISTFPAFVNDMQTLNVFFEQFYINDDEETSSSWIEKLPTNEELMQLEQLIYILYSLKTFDGSTPNILNRFDALKKFLTITIFKNEFCIIHEQIPDTLPFKHKRAFGCCILRAPNLVSRQIHHSVAHTFTDGNVTAQAAVLFEQTNSRSLTIAGASRFAIEGTHWSQRRLNEGKWPAGSQSHCQSNFSRTDAAHNEDIFFHRICLALRNCTICHDELPCFMQWHGMAETSCELDAFISAGAAGNCPIYSDEHSIVNQLTSAFNYCSLSLTAGTPRTHPNCPLFGASNLFGRYVNGVPISQLGVANAMNDSVTGEFIHIEQKKDARHATNTWKEAIESTFAEEAPRILQQSPRYYLL